VSAESPAPAPAPIRPPVTALVPVLSPHPANPSTVPINNVNAIVRIIFLRLDHMHSVSMHNRPYSLTVALNQDEKAAIARQPIKRRSSNLL
jgi:hypothetical protein